MVIGIILVAGLALAALLLAGQMGRHHGPMGRGEMSQAERPVQGAPEEGKALYERLCVTCHGASGRGDGPTGRLLTPKPSDFTKHIRGHGDEYFFKAIQEGGAAMGKSPLMPAWGSQLKPKEIWDVVSYIWTLVQGAGEPADKGDMPRMQSPGGGK